MGYAAGTTPNPTYEEVCSGLTGHNEVVLVAYDPAVRPLSALLKTFWESHDPTQGFRQGNDVGTQYRSGIYLPDEARRAEAEASREAYGAALKAQATARSRRRSATPARSTSPRSTTSNTWPRTRAAIAAWAAPACPARSGSASRRSEHPDRDRPMPVPIPCGHRAFSTVRQASGSPARVIGGRGLPGGRGLGFSTASENQ